MGERKIKNILEIGCASGYDAVKYCEYANSYIGIDISNEAISKCNNLNIINANFYCTDGHVLPIEDSSVDCVIVNSLLHHMDLPKTFSQVQRVLKSDGVLIFREPLGINPLFQIYRLLSPSARTDDERPFNLKDLRLMNSFFELKTVQWYGFTNISSAFLKSNLLRSLLTNIDNILSKTPIKYFFWQFSGIAKVKK